MKNHNKCMQNVINEIEKNLEYVAIEDLIKISGYSYYHFHRIFKAYTGESLKKYIKRLQLEKAKKKMLGSKSNITQLAIEVGFNMASSFNKAFKGMFNINPTQYRQNLSNQRESYKDIKPIRIDDIEPIEVYTIRHLGSYRNIYTSAEREKLISFAKKHNLSNQNFNLYGLPYDNPDITNNQKLRYDLCITKTKDIKLDEDCEIQTKTLSGGRYAIFLHKGNPRYLIDTFNSIFGKWIYENDITLKDVPVFQRMLNAQSKVPIDDFLIEIYVPLVNQGVYH